MSMGLQEYFLELGQRQAQCEAQASPIWNEEICSYWFEEIAPIKAVEYGIECWERMGPKALIVDISACFYRAKRLFVLDAHKEDDVVRNALVDSFGYSQILSICSGYIPSYELPSDFVKKSPDSLNEYLIRNFWEEPSQREVSGRVDWAVACRYAVVLSYMLWTAFE